MMHQLIREPIEVAPLIARAPLPVTTKARQLLPSCFLPFLPSSSSESQTTTFNSLLTNPHYNTVSMSAIAEDGDGTMPEPVKVLFTLHPGLDALDFIGPLEVLSHARHDINDPGRLHLEHHVLL
jgi:hypothetical protein